MKIASKNTEPKHTLARGSAKMLRKFASTAARLNFVLGAAATPRKAKNATIVTISPNAPRMAKTPRQPKASPITPEMVEPMTLPVSLDADRPADRPLAWLDRHEIADQRHPHRKYAAGHQPRHDAHGDKEREARCYGAGERRERDHQQTRVHQPSL